MLVFPFKKKPLKHLGSCDTAILRFHIFRHIPDIIYYSLIIGHLGIAYLLGIITNPDRLPNVYFPCVRFCFPCQHLHQRCLAAAVGTDKAYPVIFKEYIRKIVYKDLVPIPFTDMLNFHRSFTESGSGRADFYLSVSIWPGSIF